MLSFADHWSSSPSSSSSSSSQSYYNGESWPRFTRSDSYEDGYESQSSIGRSLQTRERKAKLPNLWSEVEETKDVNRDFNDDYEDTPSESGRHFSPESIKKFTETLGAINTVGRFLVNMTRSYNSNNPIATEKKETPSEDVPAAIYTISKNVLGPNVTDTIAPIVRQFPLVNLNSGKVVADKGRECTTPNQQQGVCDDLSNCPELLLDLANLRQSICFKSLFVPGVCCPIKQSG